MSSIPELRRERSTQQGILLCIYARKNKPFQIAHPLLYGFITLALIAKWTRQHNVFWTIGPSTRNRVDVINMVFTQILLAPIAFALLSFMLLLDISCGKISTVLLDSSIPCPPARILLCSVRSAIRSPLFSNTLSIRFPVHKSSPLYFVGIFKSPLLASFSMTLLALHIQPIGFPFIPVEVPRRGGIAIVAPGAFFQNILAKQRGRFLVPLMHSFGVLFIHTHATHPMKAVYRSCMWAKIALVQGFGFFALYASLCLWQKNGLLWLGAMRFFDWLSLHAFSTRTLETASNGLKFVKKLQPIAQDTHLLPCVLQILLTVLPRITLPHVFASALFALGNQPFGVFLAWIKKLERCGEKLLAISALQQGIIHDLNCLSFSALSSCCQSGKATTFSHGLITPTLGNFFIVPLFFLPQQKAERRQYLVRL
jgi:hypothetical protein